MSDELDKIITTPDSLKGNLEYAISLVWEHTDYEHVADLAALELSEIREELARLASIAEAAEQVDFHKKFLPKGTGYLEDAIYKLSGALAAYRQIVKVAENESETK